MQQQLWLLLALALVNGSLASAQTNGVPAPADFASFSRFITDRNIFDPNRQPHHSQEGHKLAAVKTRTPHSEPAFTLVGTMSYAKGMFAFFDGNSSDLRKVLPESGDIAGYIVTGVTLGGVTLQTADKKETVKMKIGEMMRQEKGEWHPAGVNESGNHSLTVSSTDARAAEASSPGAAPAAAAAPEQNEILKKLMQQREQELK